MTEPRRLSWDEPAPEDLLDGWVEGELVDCRKCGHPADVEDPQPCEAGGICDTPQT